MFSVSTVRPKKLATFFRWAIIPLLHIRLQLCLHFLESLEFSPSIYEKMIKIAYFVFKLNAVKGRCVWNQFNRFAENGDDKSRYSSQAYHVFLEYLHVHCKIIRLKINTEVVILTEKKFSERITPMGVI